MPLTHFDKNGAAHMVDVGQKEPSRRTAVAVGAISMNRECFLAVESGTAKKGDVLGAARIAGIMGAKKTPELIPLCHLIGLTKCAVEFVLDSENCMVTAKCTAQTTGVTGVEMEALTGVSCALLTIYDMCKALDKSMVISGIHLVEKHGGKSGDFFFGGAGE